jgi:hypothetical protein
MPDRRLPAGPTSGGPRSALRARGASPQGVPAVRVGSRARARRAGLRAPAPRPARYAVEYRATARSVTRGPVRSRPASASERLGPCDDGPVRRRCAAIDRVGHGLLHHCCLDREDKPVHRVIERPSAHFFVQGAARHGGSAGHIVESHEPALLWTQVGWADSPRLPSARAGALGARGDDRVPARPWTRRRRAEIHLYEPVDSRLHAARLRKPLDDPKATRRSVRADASPRRAPGGRAKDGDRGASRSTCSIKSPTNERGRSAEGADRRNCRSSPVAAAPPCACRAVISTRLFARLRSC